MRRRNAELATLATERLQEIKAQNAHNDERYTPKEASKQQRLRHRFSLLVSDTVPAPPPPLTSVVLFPEHQGTRWARALVGGALKRVCGDDCHFSLGKEDVGIIRRREPTRQMKTKVRLNERSSSKRNILMAQDVSGRASGRTVV